MHRTVRFALPLLAVILGFAAAPAQATTLSDPPLIAANITLNSTNSQRIWSWAEAGPALETIYTWAWHDWNNTYGPPCGPYGGVALPALYRTDQWATPSPGRVIPRNVFGSAYGCTIHIQSTTFWPDYQYAMQYGGSTDWTWTRTWQNANWYRRMMCRMVYHEIGHTVGHGHSSGAFGDTMRAYITQQHTPSKCASRWP